MDYDGQVERHDVTPTFQSAPRRLENRRYPHDPVWEYVGTAKKEFAYDGPGPLRVRKRVERR